MLRFLVRRKPLVVASREGFIIFLELLKILISEEYLEINY